MHKQLFEDYLYSPNELPASSIAELKQITTEYPYFQTAHLLYIKSLHSNNSILYAAHLKQAACYANDRTLLFRLIKGQHAAIRPANTPTVAGAERENEMVSAPAVAEILAADPADAPAPVEHISPEQEPLSERILRRLREIEDEHARETAPAASARLDDDGDMLRFEEDDDDEACQPVKPAAPEPLSKKVLHGRFVPHSIEYIHSLEQKIADAGDDCLRKTGSERQENIQDKLIEAFLTKQPRIIPKQPTDNEELEDISAKSSEEPGVLTETIANIYLNQKQYEKALKIYETLSLKYPQKSVYFADKISQTKELIKKK